MGMTLRSLVAGKTLDTRVKSVEAVPLVKHYLEELGLLGLFNKYIPAPSQSEVSPGQVLSVMVLNILNASRPLYKVEEWWADFTDGKGEAGRMAAPYNDDRLGRGLDALFQADRHSLMSELASRAIEIHELETRTIHNDSTTVTLSGAYQQEDEEAVKLRRGHNKDHRPGDKQIVFGLNTTADGHVPLSFQLFDGNRTDDTTHIPNWEALRNWLGREDFIYTGDGKLCTIDNMGRIAGSGGQFITVMPRTRKEVQDFHGRLEREEMPWQEAYDREDSRKKGRWIVYRTWEGPSTREGWRLIWVHSSGKEEQDRKRRITRIEQAEKRLEALQGKLNRYRLKTPEQIEEAVAKACGKVRCFLRIELVEELKIIRVQTTRGKPGPNTRWEERKEISYKLVWERDETALGKAAKQDGIFPLVTNTDKEAKEVLRIYKEQPYLEKRFHTLKSVTDIAPVFLKTPRRIEAVMFLYFVALMIISLMERNIRNNMAAENIEKLPILPQGMNTKRPTWNNIRYFFRNVHLALIIQGEKILPVSVKGITALHDQLMRLLKVPEKVFDQLRDGWWQFADS